MRRVLAVTLAAGLAAPVVLTSPAIAQTFPRAAVEKAIENQVKRVVGQAADVRCPARRVWVRGEVFHCTARPLDGSASYRVKVRLGAPKDWRFTWRQAG